MAKRVNSYTLDAEDEQEIQELADLRFEGNKSMALRALLAERRYLLARFEAQGQRTAKAERMSAAEVGGLG